MNLQLFDILVGDLLNMLNKGTDGVAMGDHKNASPFFQIGCDLALPEGQKTLLYILQGF